MDTTAWSSPLTRKLSVFTTLDGHERALLADLESDTTHLRQGQELLKRGGAIKHVQVIRDGWAMRTKTLPDGRRQVIDVVLPGDLIGFYGHVAPVAEDNVSALTPIIVASFPTERMMELFADFPRLASSMAWLAAREDQILAERLVSMGRRSAYERLAHLFLELWERLRIRGLAGNGRLPVPLTQSTLGDALGLSVVHINRTLGQLARDGLIEVKRRDRMLVILNHEGLKQAAGFEPDYLLHREIPSRLARSLEELERTRSTTETAEPAKLPSNGEKKGGFAPRP